MTTKLQNVFYKVSDTEKSGEFYSGLLGAKLQFADGERWRQYEIDGRKFALASPEEAHAKMQGAALVFEVTDLEASKAKVVSLGGTVLETRDMGSHGVTLVLSDPDGNVLHLWQRPAPKA